MKNYTVTNIMADGSVCNDLRTYISQGHPAPDLACRLIADFVRDGQQLLEAGQQNAEMQNKTKKEMP